MKTSPEQTPSARGILAQAGKPVLLVIALTAAMALIAVACRGGDDDNQPSRRDRSSDTVIMSTFTPTPEGHTPEINVTQEARQTASAATATWRAENPPPPTATPDPDATPVEEGLRPPRTWLSDGSDQMEGIFGAYGWFDDEMQTFAGVAAPFYDVGEHGLSVGPGGELEFILQDGIDEPISMIVSVYTWDDNSAIPTGTDGSVGDHLWFVPRVAPLYSVPIELDAPTFTMPSTPDRYVVQVELRWPRNDLLPPSPEFEIFGVYAFTVYVV